MTTPRIKTVTAAEEEAAINVVVRRLARTPLPVGCTPIRISTA